MRKTTLLMTLTLFTILTTGCEPRGTETGPVVCTVVVDTPTKAKEQQKMVGNARFRCEAPGADVLTVKVRLEKRNGERWNSVASKTYTMKGQQTLAQGLKYQTRDVIVNCSSGVFRTVVDWSRTSRKHTKGDNLVSGTMRDPCKPLIPLSLS